MQIRVLNDRVEIEGYVNAVERKSKPLWSRIGQFVERICKGAFKRALERNDDVKIMLNHDPSKVLGSQKQGNLELEEDPIGLHARATITDPEVVKIARDGNLVGWSFGFWDREVEQKRDEDGFPLRDVIDLDLDEVSILDNTAVPAYDGTLVAVRSDKKSIYYGETFADEINLRVLTTEPTEEVKEEEVKEERSENVPKQQETVELNKICDELKELIKDMKN